MMGLGADIAETQHCVRAELPLDRKKIIFCVWIRISRRRRRHSSLREEWREIDARIGMVRGSIQWWKRHWKRVHVTCASCRINEGRSEQYTLSSIARAIGRLRLIDGNRVALNHGIKNPISGADACFSWTADDLAQNSVRLAR